MDNNGDAPKMICPACEKGKLEPKKVEYVVYGIKLGTFTARVCAVCKEQWFDENTCLEIEKLEKEKGLFGLSRKSKISYSGNSLIVRIPESIARFMGLAKEKEVIIHPEGKEKLVIEI